MFEALRRLLSAQRADDRRGWTVRLNGKPVEVITELELESRYGLLRYGRSGAGYDQWGFEEPGGGGSVLVPYFVRKDGTVWVGVVKQPRPFQSETPVENLPRGFLDPGEAHFETALREAVEEMGLKEEDRRVFSLPGAGGNPNSTFFITLGGGVRFFGVRFAEVEMQMDGEGYVFKPDVVKPITKDAEKIMGCRFIAWTKAMELGDLFTNAGVGRLLAQRATTK